MDRDTYFQLLQKNFDKGIVLMSKKNHDYAGTEDPFKNFRAAEMLGLTVEDGIMLRLSDKFARLSNLLKRPTEVSTESFEDTAIDAMNYLNILLVYHAQQHGASTATNIHMRQRKISDNNRCNVIGDFV